MVFKVYLLSNMAILGIQPLVFGGVGFRVSGVYSTGHWFGFQLWGKIGSHLEGPRANWQAVVLKWEVNQPENPPIKGTWINEHEQL